MRKIKYMNKKSPFYLIIIVAIAIGGFIYQKFVPLDATEVTFTKCVDGDTARFIIDGEETTVRFLAIDTPETVKPGTPVQPFGKEASEYTCNVLTYAKDITLEYEPSEEKDKYGRVLAWVWVDDVLVQKKLVAEGLAEVKYLYGDYKYTAEIQNVEQEAKDKKIGIWSK